MFKVGDKVKVVYNSNGSAVVMRAMGKIGIVQSLSQVLGDLEVINVEFNEELWDGLYTVGFYKNEIEKINIKGRQMLFSFMEQ